MFIIRLGVEALKHSDNSLSMYAGKINATDNCSNDTDRFRHSILDKIKCRRQFELKRKKDKNPKKRKGILYNLLKQNNSKKSESIVKNVPKNQIHYQHERPNSLNTEMRSVKSVLNTSRPSSVPQNLKFTLSNDLSSSSSLSSPAVSNLSSSEYIEISREKLMFDWLRKIVEITKRAYSYDFGFIMSKFYQLNNNSKLFIVKQCWHLLFVTYMSEFIQNSREDVKMILSLLIKDYNKTMSNANYKKNFRITRMLTSELERIVTQIININMSPNLYNLFRVTILSIVSEPMQLEKMKKIHLLKSWLLSYQNDDDLECMLDQLLTNLCKLDVTMMESIFYGHLNPSVELTIDGLYWSNTAQSNDFNNQVNKYANGI